MFGLNKKTNQNNNNDTHKDSLSITSPYFNQHNSDEEHTSSNLSIYDNKNNENPILTTNETTNDKDMINNPQNNSSTIKIDSNWEDNLVWTADASWSRILMSDSESLRQSGSVYRQKDTNMVVLVRRLEYFPTLDLIRSTRKLFTDEISRLNKVKSVVDVETNQLHEQNPILTQASLEVESELSKITIEKNSFEKKLESEIKIIDDLVQTIIVHENKKPELIGALLKLYGFDINKTNNVVHQSSISDEKQNMNMQNHDQNKDNNLNKGIFNKDKK